MSAKFYDIAIRIRNAFGAQGLGIPHAVALTTEQGSILELESRCDPVLFNMGPVDRKLMPDGTQIASANVAGIEFRWPCGIIHPSTKIFQKD